MQGAEIKSPPRIRPQPLVLEARETAPISPDNNDRPASSTRAVSPTTTPVSSFADAINSNSSTPRSPLLVRSSRRHGTGERVRSSARGEKRGSYFIPEVLSMHLSFDRRGTYQSLPVDEEADQRRGDAFEWEEDDEDGALEPTRSYAPHDMPQWISYLEQQEVMRRSCSFVNLKAYKAASLACTVAGCLTLLAEEGWMESASEGINKMPDVDQVLALLFVVDCLFSLAHLRTAPKVTFHWPTAVWFAGDVVAAFCAVLDILVPDAKNEMASNMLSAAALIHITFLVARAAMRMLWFMWFVFFPNCAWVEHFWFQTFVGLVIILNAIIMGLETDDDSSVLWIAEQILLCFYVWEIAVRFRFFGMGFFTSPEDRWWNLLDLSIVLLGVFDQWLLKVYVLIQSGEHKKGSLGEMSMLARVMRLIRIVRLVRVVKAIRPLHDLAAVLVRAMQSMFWVLVLTFVALYSFAILTTQMLGKGLIAQNKDKLPPNLMVMFGSIADSMFTMFAIMNSQDLRKIEPLLELFPWLKPFFVIFTIYCSWALLSVMTGVVSDHMQAVRQAQKQGDVVAAESVNSTRVRVLTEVFSTLDVDGDGKLVEEEFLGLIDSPYHMQKMIDLHCPLDDLSSVFHCLDIDESGTVELEEMVEIMEWLSEPVMGRQLIRVDASVKFQAHQVSLQFNEALKSFSNLRADIRSHHEELMKEIQESFNVDETDRQAAVTAANIELLAQGRMETVFSQRASGETDAASPEQSIMYEQSQAVTVQQSQPLSGMPSDSVDE